MRRPVWLAALVGALWAVFGCADHDRGRIVPTVDRSGTIEIATLASMPDFGDPAFQWEFQAVQEILTITGDDEPPLVFDPTDLVTLRNGTLLVHDPTADHPLVLLDSAGSSVIHRFGRVGEGPGEMGSELLFAELDENIVVLDLMNRQLHRYTSDGAQLGSEPITLSSFARRGMGIPGQGFLLESLHPIDGHWRSGLEGIDALTGKQRFAVPLPEASSRARPGDIQRGRVVWTSLGQQIAAMWTDRPVIVIYDDNGEVRREVHLPLKRRRISARDIEMQVKHYGAIARSLEPGTAALTNGLYAVNDTVFGMFTSELWKSAGDPPLAMGTIWWRLFSTRGEYLGVVQLPDDFRLLGPSDHGLWARTLDEAGYPVIQDLQLKRMGGRKVLSPNPDG